MSAIDPTSKIHSIPTEISPFSLDGLKLNWKDHKVRILLGSAGMVLGGAGIAAATIFSGGIALPIILAIAAAVSASGVFAVGSGLLSKHKPPKMPEIVKPQPPVTPEPPIKEAEKRNWKTTILTGLAFTAAIAIPIGLAVYFGRTVTPAEVSQMLPCLPKVAPIEAFSNAVPVINEVLKNAAEEAVIAAPSPMETLVNHASNFVENTASTVSSVATSLFSSDKLSILAPRNWLTTAATVYPLREGFHTVLTHIANFQKQEERTIAQETEMKISEENRTATFTLTRLLPSQMKVEKWVKENSPHLGIAWAAYKGSNGLIAGLTNLFSNFNNKNMELCKTGGGILNSFKQWEIASFAPLTALIPLFVTIYHDYHDEKNAHHKAEGLTGIAKRLYAAAKDQVTMQQAVFFVVLMTLALKNNLYAKPWLKSEAFNSSGHYMMKVTMATFLSHIIKNSQNKGYATQFAQYFSFAYAATDFMFLQHTASVCHTTREVLAGIGWAMGLHKLADLAAKPFEKKAKIT